MSLLTIAVYFGVVVIYKAAVALHRIDQPYLSPIHAEAWLALAVNFSLVFNSLTTKSEPSSGNTANYSWRQAVWPVALVAALISLAYWRTLSNPLLSDDYLIVMSRRDWRWAGIVHQFRVPGGDGFFRPITNLTLSATGLWAGPGNRPQLWRLVALALDCINAILVYVFALQLKLPRTAAIAAACIFSVHAAHPEAVAWIAGRFDLVSTLFVLLAVVLFKAAYQSHYFDLLIGLAALSMMLAALSKEPGFIFPVLATLVAWHAGEKSKRVLLSLGIFYAVAAALFAYRWRVMGGIGGYVDLSGRPQALHFSLVRAFNILFLRIWTVLYFPINWSVQPGVLLLVLLAVYIGALLCLMRSRPSHRDILLGVGLVVATTLVPLHLLVLNQDLQGTRMVYLTSAAFSILVGVALAGLSPKVRSLCALTIILFNFGALTHNLAIWGTVSLRAQDACKDAAALAGASVSHVVVQQLPQSIDGVFFFANGFPACVEAAAGRKIEVEVDRGAALPPSNNTLLLRWNRQLERLECGETGASGCK